MVTMQQIADRCGVSRGTVDRALHHKEGVREEVAERIRATAREMGYISNRLVMQQTQQWKIGVACTVICCGCVYRAKWAPHRQAMTSISLSGRDWQALRLLAPQQLFSEERKR